MKIIRLYCLALLASMASTVYAQDVTTSPLELVSSSGFIDQNPNRKHTFSVGEVVANTLSNAQMNITQGYLQPQIEGPCSQYNITFYPNPTKRYVYLDVLHCDTKVDYVEVYDAFGKVVMDGTLDAQGKFDLYRMGVGVYFLKVFIYKGGFTKTIKIVKVAK